MPSLVPDLARERGLYVHIPFCVQKCAYCDFYSLPHQLDRLDSYLEAVALEACQYAGLKFQTLYVGGGTPSLLQAAGLNKLLGSLGPIFDLSSVTEATLEANPESITPDWLQAALSRGVNRISIGVQSLSDSELERVGRVHTASQAMRAIEMTQKHGFRNVSADAILGLPGQDWTSLLITLETLIGMGLPHISLYCLSIEPHTPLAIHPPPGIPSDDEQAELYENSLGLLHQRGYLHYEISNFALPGYECRHNLNYWRGGEYLGLGPAAASHFQGKRFKNKSDLEAYLQDPCRQIEEIEDLPQSKKAGEEAILRLRLLEEGLNITEMIERLGDENLVGLMWRLDQLVKEGFLTRSGAIYRLKPEWALVSNSILARVLED